MKIGFNRYGVGVFLLIAALLNGCATGGGAQGLQVDFGRGQQRNAPLAVVAKQYTGTCVGGQRESNNCAHFLSDAFIRAGYTELLKRREVVERCRCGANRVVRAQDMLKWFQEKAERFQAGTPEKGTGMWAAYQEKPNKRHVLIYDADTGKYYGTDNCVNWPVQWYYQW